MAARHECSDSVPSSLPPPRPKSPPEYPDLYGKRREMAKVQVLEREIGFLEVELKSVDSLQPASRCCKEIVDFVAANSDPLIPTHKKKLRRYHRFWKWLCGLPCFNLSWIYCCCYSGCTLSGCAVQIEMPKCCKCHPHYCCDCDCNCNCAPSCPSSCLSCTLPKCLRSSSCLSCTLPKCLRWRPNWRFWSCPRSYCCKNVSFGRHRCCFSLPAAPLPSCSFPTCNCNYNCKFKCSWRCPKCPSIHPCSCLSSCLPSSSCCSCSRCFNPCYLCC